MDARTQAETALMALPRGGAPVLFWSQSPMISGWSRPYAVPREVRRGTQRTCQHGSRAPRKPRHRAVPMRIEQTYGPALGSSGKAQPDRVQRLGALRGPRRHCQVRGGRDAELPQCRSGLRGNPAARFASG